MKDPLSGEEVDSPVAVPEQKPTLTLKKPAAPSANLRDPLAVDGPTSVAEAALTTSFDLSQSPREGTVPATHFSAADPLTVSANSLPVPASDFAPTREKYHGLRYATPQETATLLAQIDSGFVPKPDTEPVDEDSVPLPSSNFTPDPITGQLAFDRSKPLMIWGEVDHAEVTKNPVDLVKNVVSGFTRHANESTAGKIRAVAGMLDLQEYLQRKVFGDDTVEWKLATEKKVLEALGLPESTKAALGQAAAYLEDNARNFSGKTPERSNWTASAASDFGMGLALMAELAALTRIGVPPTVGMGEAFGLPAFGQTYEQAKQAGMEAPAAASVATLSASFNTFIGELVKRIPVLKDYLAVEGNSLLQTLQKRFTGNAVTLETMQAGNKLIEAIASRQNVDTETAGKLLSATIADIMPTLVTTGAMLPIDMLHSPASARQMNRLVQEGAKSGWSDRQTMAFLHDVGVVEVDGRKVQLNSELRSQGVMAPTEQDLVIQDVLKDAASKYNAAVKAGTPAEEAYAKVRDEARARLASELEVELAPEQPASPGQQLMNQLSQMPSLSTEERNQLSQKLDVVMEQIKTAYPEWTPEQNEMTRKLLFHMTTSAVLRGENSFAEVLKGFAEVQSGTGAEGQLKRDVTSPEFREWFSGSVITNPDGTPRMLYHGSEKSVGTIASDRGFWLAFDPQAASPGSGEVAGSITPVFASVKNPYKLTAEQLEQFKLSTNPKKYIRTLRESLPREYDAVQVGDYALVVFDKGLVKSPYNSGEWDRRSGNLLKQERPARPNFLLTFPLFLESKKFGASLTSAMDSASILQRLESFPAAKAELELYKHAGLVQWLEAKKRTPAEVIAWMNENGPKVTTTVYGQEPQVHPDKLALDEMTHVWYDNLSPEQQLSVSDWVNFPDRVNRKRLLDNPDIRAVLESVDQKKLQEYARLHQSVHALGRTLTGPRATGYYDQVSPFDTKKFPVVRIDLSLPIQERDVMWQPDQLHENIANTFGWAMVQIVPHNGEQVMFVGELQSRWAQKVRAEKETYKDNPDFYKNLPDSIDTPFLEEHQRLIAKAVIQEARKRGIERVVFSDGETAMLTEMHDRTTAEYFQSEASARQYAAEREGSVISKESDRTNPLYVWKVSLRPEQEPGMRLNYDRIIPKIVEELTGVRGERVELGEHKNVYDRQSSEQVFDNDPLRSDLIFKNPDGTPKTSVTGYSFPVAGARENFTFFGRNKAGGDPLFESKIGQVRGSIEFIKDMNAIIYLMKGADFETVMHEFTHAFSRHLNAEDVSVWAQWTKVPEADLLAWQQAPHDPVLTDKTRKAHEELANGFMRFLASARTPTAGMETLFGKLKAWFKGAYLAFRQFDSEKKRKLQATMRDVQGAEIKNTLLSRKLMTDLLVTPGEHRQELGEIYNPQTGQRWEIYYGDKKNTFYVYHRGAPSEPWRAYEIGKIMQGQLPTAFERGVFGGDVRWLGPNEVYTAENMADKQIAYRRALSLLSYLGEKQLANVAKTRGITIPEGLTLPQRADYVRGLMEAEWNLSMKDRPFYGHERSSWIDAILTEAGGDRKKALELMFLRNPIRKSLAAIATAVDSMFEYVTDSYGMAMKSRAPNVGPRLEQVDRYRNNVEQKIRGLWQSEIEQWQRLWSPERYPVKQQAQAKREIADLRSKVWNDDPEWYRITGITSPNVKVPFFYNEKWILLARYNLDSWKGVPLSPIQKTIIQQYRRLFAHSGELMETGSTMGVKIGDGGVMIYDRNHKYVGEDGVTQKKGKDVPFKRLPYGVQNISSYELLDLMQDPAELGRQRLALSLGESHESDAGRIYNSAYWTRTMDNLHNLFTSNHSRQKVNGMERVRAFRNMPSGIMLEVDKRQVLVRIMETDPWRHVNRMMGEAARRYAFVSTFAPYDGTVGRYLSNTYQKRGDKSPFVAKLRAQREEYVKDLHPARKVSGTAIYDEWMRLSQGLPKEQGKLVQPGTFEYEAHGFGRSASELLRASTLSGINASIVNLFDMGQPFKYFGVVNTLKNIPAAFTPRRWMSAEMQSKFDMASALGAKGMMLPRWSVDPHHPIASRVKMLSTMLRYGNMWTNNRQELLAAYAGMEVVEALRANKAQRLHEETLRIMGFTSSEVAQLMSGRGTQEMYEEIIRRSPQVATGQNTMPTQIPRAFHNETFKNLVFFWQYYQNKWMGVYKNLHHVADDMKRGVPFHRSAATGALMRDALGLTIGGVAANLAGSLIRSLVRGDDEELKVFANKFRPENLVGTLWEAMYTQLLWGPFLNLGRNVIGDSASQDVVKSILSVSLPVSFVWDASKAAGGIELMGDGSYVGLSGQERFLKFMTSHVGALATAKLALYPVLSDYEHNPGLEVAQREYFKAIRRMDLPRTIIEHVNEPAANAKFRADMRKVAKQVAAQGVPSKDAWESVYGRDGASLQRIKSSLANSNKYFLRAFQPRVVNGIVQDTPEQLQEKAAVLQALKQQLHPDHYRLLEQHDAALEAFRASL